MTRQSQALSQNLYQYLQQISVVEHPVQRALREFTATHRLAKMQISREQGHFMAWLAHLTGARRYLEIGVFTGYSALTLALAMGQQGTVVACDVSDEFTRIARDYWQQAGVAQQIQLILQPALQTLDSLLAESSAELFDLAFIDADKPSYPAYYEACLQLVRPGGIIMIDNVFLNGRVCQPRAADPPGVQVLHDFNAFLRQDPRIQLSVLPLGDGLTLAVKC